MKLTLRSKYDLFKIIYTIINNSLIKRKFLQRENMKLSQESPIKLRSYIFGILCKTFTIATNK